MPLYRLLLRLYPASFRHEYGEEMCRLFAERRRGVGFGTRIGVWLEALYRCTCPTSNSRTTAFPSTPPKTS